jgi:hypothetical protein
MDGGNVGFAGAKTGPAILAENCSCVFCTSAIHGGREPDSWHSLPTLAKQKSPA